MSIREPVYDDATEALLDAMVDAYGKAIQAEHGHPDATFDDPYIRHLQRIGMVAVLEAANAPLAKQTREAYYKGRDYGKRAERDKREQIIEGYIERARHWKDRALVAERELRDIRHAQKAEKYG